MEMKENLNNVNLVPEYKNNIKLNDIKNKKTFNYINYYFCNFL